MGWEIKHTAKGYQITSTVSGKLIHKKKYMNEEETKAVMAEVALYEFFEQLIKIDKDFLIGYSINGERDFSKPKTALKWMIDNEGKIEEEGKTILNRLLAIKID
jgi:hypothetical protein